MTTASRAAETTSSTKGRKGVGAAQDPTRQPGTPEESGNSDGAPQGTDHPSASPSGPEGPLEEGRAQHEDGAEHRFPPGGSEDLLKHPPEGIQFSGCGIGETPSQLMLTLEHCPRSR